MNGYFLANFRQFRNRRLKCKKSGLCSFNGRILSEIIQIADKYLIIKIINQIILIKITGQPTFVFLPFLSHGTEVF
ncbi:MAG: hypothetical protein CMJ32_10855 [Phycisphaerae bacterium]|nr:hypothetical protein [Phycisphaerae bacterium]